MFSSLKTSSQKTITVLNENRQNMREARADESLTKSVLMAGQVAAAAVFCVFYAAFSVLHDQPRSSNILEKFPTLREKLITAVNLTTNFIEI